MVTSAGMRASAKVEKPVEVKTEKAEAKAKNTKSAKSAKK